MPVQKVFAFGCESAEFLTPGNPPVYYPIKSVQEAEFGMEVDETDVKGDDDIQTTWLHSPKATLKLKHAVIDPEVFERVTGNAVTTENGPPQIDSILLGTDSELEPPVFAVRLTLKARDAVTGTNKTFELYAYKCVGKIKLEGIKHGESVTVSIEAKCFRSATDEYGQTLAEPARAKMRIKAS